MSETSTEGPDWTCAACGSSGPFKDIEYPNTPNGPAEYDIECQECGSLSVAESAAEAARTLGKRLEETLADRDAWKERAKQGTQLVWKLAPIVCDHAPDCPIKQTGQRDDCDCNHPDEDPLAIETRTYLRDAAKEGET